VNGLSLLVVSLSNHWVIPCIVRRYIRHSGAGRNPADSPRQWLSLLEMGHPWVPAFAGTTAKEAPDYIAALVSVRGELVEPPDWVMN